MSDMTKRTFWEAFAEMEAAARATVDGASFFAAGFELYHNGGGCTAWRRDIPGRAKYILVTDTEGCSHSLGESNAIWDGPDLYLIGVHCDSGIFTECETAETAADAIKAADAMSADASAGR